jgi:hypothetical protein
MTREATRPAYGMELLLYIEFLHGMTQTRKFPVKLRRTHFLYPGIPLMELLHQQQGTGEGIRSIGEMVLTYEARSTRTTNPARSGLASIPALQNEKSLTIWWLVYVQPALT